MVLLLSVYGLIILGLFVHPRYGVVNTFHNNLPLLSARVEKHVATGVGFWHTQSAPLRWRKP